MGMTEKIVEDNLDFLCEQYGFNYTFAEFENYLNTNIGIDTYSYHNEYGCFTITNFAARGEIDYICLDNIQSLKDFLCPKYPDEWSTYNKELMQYLKVQYLEERGKHEINIFNTEPEIWEKHRRKFGFLKIPFFWGSNKQVFKALAEVIEAQIEKNGSFFGIKVKSDDRS